MAVGYAGVDYGVCGLPEIQDSPRVLANKLKKLVGLFKTSKYIVVHTGAGVSTSCGIPDFRGPKGVWTLEKQGRLEDAGSLPWQDVVPSVTHMALVGLLKRGIVKYVVSQNVDCLHLKSGVTPDRLSELHGNVFRETCEKCNKVFVRDFDIQTIGFEHTGRNCDECGGKLIDFLLDWDDALPEDALERAHAECEKADLAVCFGTSLRVYPANTLPMKTVKKGGKLVIVNLQATPKDKTSALKINATCDMVVEHLMRELSIPIPTYSPVAGEVIQKQFNAFLADERAKRRKKRAAEGDLDGNDAKKRKTKGSDDTDSVMEDDSDASSSEESEFAPEEDDEDDFYTDESSGAVSHVLTRQQRHTVNNV